MMNLSEAQERALRQHYGTRVFEHRLEMARQISEAAGANQ
jgi:hypothetical protein